MLVALAESMHMPLLPLNNQRLRRSHLNVLLGGLLSCVLVVLLVSWWRLVVYLNLSGRLSTCEISWFPCSCVLVAAEYLSMLLDK